ncbi:hypothetical protein ACQKPE_11950 [Pseudomonas sp. NPDC089554]|uniref:hypothetical protein n=1 Tax=Pseudomonas sp. NPDC089554 TaxID=3390653 RepID=UPI003D060C81
MPTLTKTFAWLCAGMFSTTVLAGTPGLEEYHKAMATQEQLGQIADEVLNADVEAIKQLPAAEKEAKAKHMLTVTSDYREQLRASATAGFAPAQYLYAVLLKSENRMGQPPKNDRSAVCELLNDASRQGFMAASLGRARYCNKPNSAAELLTSSDAVRASLRSDIDRQDPYGAFYPVQAFTLAECIELPTPEVLATMSQQEQLLAMQPPFMDLEQFKAEAHFQLAALEQTDNRDMAQQHLSLASEFGCYAKTVEAMQRALARGK